MAASQTAYAPTWRYSQTYRPGHYLVRLTDANSKVTAVEYHVQRTAGESDFRPLSEAERSRLTSLSGIQFGSGTGPQASDADALAADPPREPLWGLLLAALVALLACELILANLLSRRRQPDAISLV
jgi:hypothetical protein